MTSTELCEETIELAKQLINIESVSPNDNGCQELLGQYLQALDFNLTHVPSAQVSNLWAERGSKQTPLFVFAGHTDVVPPGQLENWHSPPFTASIRNGYLYGRGAADMKSALAAMVIACKRFIHQHPQHRGAIGFMITSDEESSATDGTIKLVEYLQQQQRIPTWCVIGEASSNATLGDAIKIGRRGSLHGNLQVFGKQGHIAYPHLAENPIHRSFKALDELTQIEWDRGNEEFTPTSLQIYSIKADTGASNIIPGALTANFNFRYAPPSNAENLKQRVHNIFDAHQLNYEIHWQHSCEPFLSRKGQLIPVCSDAILQVCQLQTQPNTTGGTSDGRFIHKMNCEIVELGPSSKSIHHVNECINLAELSQLTHIYQLILEKLLL